MDTKPGDTGLAKTEVVGELEKAQEMKVQETKPTGDIGDVSDPDEDDLDDLDDMLDEFSTVKLDSKKPEVPAPGPGRSATTAVLEPKPKAVDDVLADDDFAKQLQAGMAELMGEIESSPEITAQFESIFKELGAAAAAPEDGPSSSTSAPAAESTSKTSKRSVAAEASFQETIRKTMERMRNSGEQATAAAAAEGSDDFMAELLKQMESGGLEGEGNEEEFSKILLGMMEQLTNRDVLYEPMKELNDKFPNWMEKNDDKITDEDRKRYQLQQGLVKEIVSKFEESTYTDSNPADREYIVDRMQKMQAAGSPPPDLVGDMPSAQEALNVPDAESCNPQ